MKALRLMRLWLVWACLACAALHSFAPAPALAQGILGPAASADELAPPDYKQWEKTATRAEREIADRETDSVAYEAMRGYLVEWRDTFLRAQGINASRIASVRGQIDALGPAPAEGATEPDDIAQRRKDLTEQLAELRAPVVSAEEAYQRADGLIREIDRVVRERQTQELLRIWPMPLNPANWPAAAGEVSTLAVDLWNEGATRLASERARATARDNLPAILGLLAVGLLLIARGRALMERLTQTLQDQASARGRKVGSLLVSLGQIVAPVAGVMAVSHAIKLSAMAGPRTTLVVEVLPAVSLILYAAGWLAGRVFPKNDLQTSPLNLSEDRRREGRFHTAMFGVVMALDALRTVALPPARVGEAATSVMAFPFIVVAGLLLFRIGQLMLASVRNDLSDDEPSSFRNSVIDLLGRGTIAIGVIAPLLALPGYIAAATALVYPAGLTLGLIGVLFVLQTLVVDLYGLATRNEDGGRDALLPVLIGFLLALALVPLLALVWGARVADLTEIWARFREGYQVGSTRISPTSFLLLAIVFSIGYGITRLLQGALKSQILPKTRLDQGGRNAVVSGVGYLGIILAALVAVNSAGLDLSNLAIVAGALSVGIGFGLQNIVGNFVSGIILLIERPVSEGDWIEVGGVQGTVKSISVRSTRIQTFDRTDVIVPNQDLVAGQVTNWTRYNMTGRLIVPVGVAYGSDTRHVERVLREIAEAQPLAILNPPPSIVFMGFTQEFLSFEIRVILRDVNFSLSVRSDINHMIAKRFAEEGIGLTHMPRDIWPAPEPEVENGLTEEEMAALLVVEPQQKPQKDNVPKGTHAVDLHRQTEEVEDADGDGDPDADGASEGTGSPR
ncbi:mechanosensitive ion channel family protein [Cereibacter sphaeroides]|nr:mechanosensitive ion channel family protein [Cereibacter sphaeroides]